MVKPGQTEVRPLMRLSLIRGQTPGSGKKKGPRERGPFKALTPRNYSSGASRAFQSASLTNFVRFVPSFWARRA